MDVLRLSSLDKDVERLMLTEPGTLSDVEASCDFSSDKDRLALSDSDNILLFMDSKDKLALVEAPIKLFNSSSSSSVKPSLVLFAIKA